MRKGYSKLIEEEQDLHERFVEYGGNTRVWMNKCKLLLLEIDRTRVWEKRGFRSIYEYASKLSGMSERLVDQSLWILRNLEDKPDLMKVAKEKSLNSVRPVITVATISTDRFWAEKARVMNREELMLYVKEWRERFEKLDEFGKFGAINKFAEFNKSDNEELELFPETEVKNIVSLLPRQRLEQGNGDYSNQESRWSKADSSSQGSGWSKADSSNQANRNEDHVEGLISPKTNGIEYPNAPRIIVPLYLAPELAEKLCRLNNDDWNEPIAELLRLRNQMLDLEKPTVVEAASRHMPSAMTKFILKRSNSKCEFPGCVKYYFELHHADRFMQKWTHDPDRIFALCNNHHKLIHQGLIENEEKDVRFWRIRDYPNRQDARYDIDKLVMKFRKVGQHQNRKLDLSDQITKRSTK
ncbi:MAG: hypothetical protein O3B47_04420 [bacterium]|nr:hypothetical protein [bacterium]